MTEPTQPIVILGAGFTGLFTALHLDRHNCSREIILIDKSDRFTFQPLLYEFFSEEMDAEQVCPRYDELLENRNVTFVQGYIENINLPQRCVHLAAGTSYDYDYLVLALGSVVNYLGIEGAKEYSFPFRNQQDASKLQRHLRSCLQQASQTSDSQKRQQLLTVACMGGGPAGVELAGTLGDLLPNWYADLGGDPQDLRLLLFEKDTEILQEDINAQVRDIARKSLQQRTLPVELCFEHRVTEVKRDRIVYQYQDQTHTLPQATFLWTAGVCCHPLIRQLPIPQTNRDRHGRVMVKPTLQLPDFPEVFAGGDCAAEQECILPPLAQVAYQEGATIAHNINNLCDGKELTPADVNLRGSMLKLGLKDSAANLFDRFQVTGKPGHLIRQAMYLELLPTPIHNFKVTAEWMIDEIFQRYGSSVEMAEKA
ncbi:MAG: NAD(P)/FAD-dependent oxidoreductase [Spirulinaceae cyanobacterium]